jgi:hypothetical protein
MVLCIALVALVNLGLGFALAIHLARRHRSLTALGAGFQSLDSAVTFPPVESKYSPDATATGVEDLQARVRQCNDQLTNLESRVPGTDRRNHGPKP